MKFIITRENAEKQDKEVSKLCGYTILVDMETSEVKKIDYDRNRDEIEFVIKD